MYDRGQIPQGHCGVANACILNGLKEVIIIGQLLAHVHYSYTGVAQNLAGFLIKATPCL
ncbi:uncharacterized protein PHALS_01948 [Plasmopara halstedii]|uniref:Uncharacterized protein n=1 Tax=Plasmopara halstedii TaxID=4781 RepID=A0A0P1AY70_PLAHL|nr:uncharacterized protein PHALS_01948 [Plasmopara halstedii]CEG45665.1 hypothetical protein PHALS_01948 [Plasmopara halstedii]|eukprot:XP_024582034.1 hypothetical protein PHALS_01948 [Plasmopara halstedii]